MFLSLFLQKLVSTWSVHREVPVPFPLQETVSASRRTFTARELRSGTDYLVTVIAQYPNSVGESVSAKQRTSEWKKSRRQMWAKRINSKKHHYIIIMFRVFTRGLQFTSGTGRVLLPVSGLGSAHVSRARLQTHLRTKRLGAHTQRHTLILDPKPLAAVVAIVSGCHCGGVRSHFGHKSFLRLWHDGGPFLSVLCLHGPSCSGCLSCDMAVGHVNNVSCPM